MLLIMVYKFKYKTVYIANYVFEIYFLNDIDETMYVKKDC